MLSHDGEIYDLSQVWTSKRKEEECSV
jgi:hypothetical protein